MKHESETLEAVMKARSAVASARQAGNIAALGPAEGALRMGLGSLFAVAEAYPDLKANENFLELQRELTDTEDKIAYARQFYNTNTGSYNEKIQVFPGAMFAGMFGFQREDFYEAEEAAREEIQVSFSSD